MGRVHIGSYVGREARRVPRWHVSTGVQPLCWCKESTWLYWKELLTCCCGDFQSVLFLTPNRLRLFDLPRAFDMAITFLICMDISSIWRDTTKHISFTFCIKLNALDKVFLCIGFWVVIDVLFTQCHWCQLLVLYYMLIFITHVFVLNINSFFYTLHLFYFTHYTCFLFFVKHISDRKSVV